MSAYQDRLKSGCEFRVGEIPFDGIPVYPIPTLIASDLSKLRAHACTHPDRRRPECCSACPALGAC